MRIILDLDDVLADFVGGACRASGISREVFYSLHQPGEYYMHKCMGVSWEEWAAPVKALGVSFWENLDKTPWCDRLLALVGEMTPDWVIATAPFQDEACWIGKIRWVQKVIGPEFDRLIITKHKHLLMGSPDTILIDDRETTCDRIEVGSGHAILFPTLHNRLYRYAKNPLPHVLARLEDL